MWRSYGSFEQIQGFCLSWIGRAGVVKGMCYLWAILLTGLLLSCDDKPEKSVPTPPPPPDSHNLQKIYDSTDFNIGVSSFDDTFHGINVRCYVCSVGISCVQVPKE